MDSNSPFNLTIFTDITKKICICSAVSIFLILLFMITPLSKYTKISMFMKLLALILFIYIIYLNNQQTNLLRSVSSSVNSEEVKSQLNMNIICSYVFTIFIGLLVIFVIKSFF
jgi:hypothetical protein